MRGIPLQNDHGMGAWFNAIFASPQGVSERMRFVTIIVKHKIGMTIAGEPARYFLVLLGNGGSDSDFGARTVVPGGSGGNVVLTSEAFAQFIVGTANMLAEGMASRSLVLRKIARNAPRRVRLRTRGKRTGAEWLSAGGRLQAVMSTANTRASANLVLCCGCGDRVCIRARVYNWRGKSTSVDIAS